MSLRGRLVATLVCVAALSAPGVALAGTLGATGPSRVTRPSRRSQPVQPVQPVQPAPLSLAPGSLGLPTALQFTAANDVQTHAVPVPAGMRALTLTGVIHAPVNFGPGSLEIDSETGNVIGATALPAVGANQVERPFRIDLTHVPTSGGMLTLGFVVRQAAPGLGACGPAQQLDVTDLRLQLSGTATQPSTIAAFFSPALTAIRIYVPAQPTPAESQAALQLTAAIVAHYEPLPISVSVAALPLGGAVPSVPATPLTRAIVIRQGGPPGLAIEPDASGHTRLLVLSGAAPMLPVQVSLFLDDLSALAQGSSATVTGASVPTLQTASVYTLSQLGISASTATLGQGNVSFGLDQGLLGGPLSSITLHLLASYTPVPANANATVTVSVHNVVLYTGRLGGSGRLDTTVQMPLPLLSRDTSVQLALTDAPSSQCSPLTPAMNFSIDPRSTVTVTHLGHAAGGFSALPTAFLGGFDVTIQDASVQDLRYATLAVAGLQALTHTTLQPELVDSSQAKVSNLGVLVVGDSSEASALGLDPPLSGNGSHVEARLRGTLGAEIPDGIGSIQAFADSQRDRTVLLVTTTSTWGLVESLFDYLASPADGGWGALTGDVLVSSQAAPPADLAIRDSGVVLFTPPQSNSWRIWLYLGGGALIVLLGLALARKLVARSDRD